MILVFQTTVTVPCHVQAFSLKSRWEAGLGNQISLITCKYIYAPKHRYVINACDPQRDMYDLQCLKWSVCNRVLSCLLSEPQTQIKAFFKALAASWVGFRREHWTFICYMFTSLCIGSTLSFNWLNNSSPHIWYSLWGETKFSPLSCSCLCPFPFPSVVASPCCVKTPH